MTDWKDWIENPNKAITREEFSNVFKEKLGIDVEEDEDGNFYILTASGEKKSAVEFLRDVEIKLA